jgi:hypothetical protein
LTSIPAGLFSGLSSAPAERMFFYAFAGCSGLTGSIPAYLFSGIGGAPAEWMFSYTFSGCSKLTDIGDPFIGELTGGYDFSSTFSSASSLSGKEVKDTAGTVLYTVP